MKSLSSIVVVMLAAGSSRRFGADKRLARIAGSPLLQQSLSIPLSRGHSTLLVLKPEDELCLEQLVGPWYGNERLHIVYAQQAEKGMGYSLAAAAGEVGDYQGLVVMLGDMPYLKPRTLDKICEAYERGAIIVPRCDGRPGHPVLFSSEYFPALQKLRGDRGAKSVLTANAASVHYIDVQDLGIHQDIDYPLA